MPDPNIRFGAAIGGIRTCEVLTNYASQNRQFWRVSSKPPMRRGWGQTAQMRR